MPLTDTGNAERLVARFRDRIRYCPPRKRWFIWDGRRWALDQLGEIEQLAKRTVRAIYSEAEHARDGEAAEAIAAHAVRSEKRERRTAMVALAQSEPGIPLLPSDFDADPWALNVLNGTIDLRTGELRPHRREDLMTKLAPVEYLPGARHQLWEKYLHDSTGGDAELSAYLQRIAGYALFGQVTEKAFWFLYGPPDGMKSTFIDAVSASLGDYAVSADFSTWLVQTNTGGNRGDLVSLLGARLVCSVEVRRGAKFDESIMKRVTGGDAIKAAAKYEAEIEFSPTFSLWLAANDAPVVRDDDEGFWSRVRRIPFVHPLPPDQRDPQMRDKLREPDAQRAILAWTVEGCMAWQREGFGHSQAVEASTAQYRDEMDRSAGFFAECCAFEEFARTKSSELRTAYEEWCRENGISAPLSGKELAQRLKARGAAQTKSNGQRWWSGVRLLGDDEAPIGAAGSPGHASPGTFSTYAPREDFTGNPCPADPGVPVRREGLSPQQVLEHIARGAE